MKAKIARITAKASERDKIEAEVRLKRKTEDSGGQGKGEGGDHQACCQCS